jgi:hypothetical protein
MSDFEAPPIPKSKPPPETTLYITTITTTNASICPSLTLNNITNLRIVFLSKHFHGVKVQKSLIFMRFASEIKM